MKIFQGTQLSIKELAIQRDLELFLKIGNKFSCKNLLTLGMCRSKLGRNVDVFYRQLLFLMQYKLKVSRSRKQFKVSSNFSKKRRKQFVIVLLGKENEFVHSVFGRIASLKKTLRLCMTFSMRFQILKDWKCFKVSHIILLFLAHCAPRAVSASSGGTSRDQLENKT